jgi:NodT family efflux transporter outer membrane factor (OMF) lipoprotein
MNRILAPVFALVLFSGCAVGPNYHRPVIQTPGQFRGADAPASAESLADLKWFELFEDETLRQHVRNALEQNFDLRIAAARVLQARAQLGTARSGELPSLDIGGEFVANRGSSTGSITFIKPGTNLDVSYTQAGFKLGWELDLWGRLRRLTEAARAEYLASEEVRRGVVVTLVGDVTATYFTLRELDAELEISNEARGVAEDSVRLTKLRRDRGVATGLDVHQAEQFLYTATAQIRSIERSIGQTENALSLLMGKSPGDVPRGKALEMLAVPPSVPAGLPSSLLERRPDIREAERRLVAANARIGAARAEYFPRISLTGLLGGQSRALTELFTGPARNWSFTPAAAFPLFDAGRIRAGVRLAEGAERETLATYEKAIQTAFREVSDALVDYGKTGEQRGQQELLVQALRESVRLSTRRYQGGLDSYLQVLDAERNLFQGELTLARLRRQELGAVVQLYKALGGGWE